MCAAVPSAMGCRGSDAIPQTDSGPSGLGGLGGDGVAAWRQGFVKVADPLVEGGVELGARGGVCGGTLAAVQRQDFTSLDGLGRAMKAWYGLLLHPVGYRPLALEVVLSRVSMTCLSSLMAPLSPPTGIAPGSMV